MDRIRLIGGNELRGEIPISGAKNAALPLMIASLLTKDPLVLENVPRLADVTQLEKILENHGVDIAVHGRRAQSLEGQRMTLEAAEIVDTTAPYELVSTMRASFWVIGPLLARAHEARVSLPGGCAIGTRPVDLFLYGLKELGAEIDIDEGYVVAKAPRGRLRGGRVSFPKVTVGATHVLMMAATLARGETVIENAAMEPEISNVAECLVAMGAKIDGIGTRTLTIQGVDELHGATHHVLPDRIETGTYAMAAAMTGGDVLLKNARAGDLKAALETLVQAGVHVSLRGERRAHRAQRQRHPGGRYRDAAVPRLPDRPAGPVHGADDHGQRHLAYPRDDFREPLHARGGTRPLRRRHQGGRPGRDRHRRAAAEGRAGDGDRPASLGVAWSSPASPRAARRWSTASTISTAASSGSRTSSRRWAPGSSASPADALERRAWKRPHSVTPWAILYLFGPFVVETAAGTPNMVLALVAYFGSLGGGRGADLR